MGGRILDGEVVVCGKVALITGGASGIGRATAVGFAEQGRTLSLPDAVRPRERSWSGSLRRQAATACLIRRRSEKTSWRQKKSVLASLERMCATARGAMPTFRP